ncbi:MAG: enoyl-CoA hydratase/isomerase family protein [Spirochaetota bacterium]|jgi:polyketide biosynthesis enoyl-CoA hydratase PksI|nr:enoyl-CoA hydratase/isomerase family protein [Spirochaetota bacterium]
MTERVTLSVNDAGIAHLAMQDEANKNLFSDDFIHELVSAIERAEALRPKVLLLSGLSDVFAAGAEKKNLMDLCDGKVHVKDLVISERLVHASFPVIAAMEGHALGGGLVMAACCDMVIAARESRYGVVFMGLGFTPGMGCTKILQGLVGPQLANEMMFTAKRFRGSELASMWHNFNYILPRNEVMPRAWAIARQIAEKNINSIYLLKYALSAEKKKLLIEARVQEDYMHKISFAYPETRGAIEEFYAGE